MTDAPYLRIAAEMERRMAAGELRAGDRVPSTRQIARDFGVAMATATKALSALRQRGSVRAVPGVGTLVERSDPTPTAPPVAQPASGRAGGRNEDGGTLTRHRIVERAVAVADAEGLGALSMRRVAAALDVGVMSLYRYVASKDELVVLMMDAVMGEVLLAEPPPPGWRAQLELIAREQWEGYCRHPWLAEALSLTRPQPTPNALPHTEWALRAVDGFGLSPNAMLYVALTVFSYVRGAAVNLVAEAEAEHESGLSPDEYIATQSSALDALRSSGRFPVFSRVTADVNFDFDLDLNTLFDFGLRQLLDGLEAYLERM